MRVSVWGSEQLQALLLALRLAPREVRAQARKATRERLVPLWKTAIAENVQTRLEARVLAEYARVTVSDQNVTLKAAGSNKKLSGGLIPRRHWRAVEFGAHRERVITYERRSPSGTVHSVSRKIGTTMRRPNRKGYALYPSMARVIPQFLSIWVSTGVRVIAEAIEKSKS